MSYGYANDGNVLRIPASEPSPNILHDSLSRLTLDRAASGGKRTYSYYDAGNRLSAIPGGAVSYPDPAGNRWSSADGGAIPYLFDDAGNVTTRGAVQLTTDDDGSVVAITGASGTTAYTRDHQNLRLTKAGAGGAATFLHSASGELTQRIGAADTVTCPDSSVGPSIPYENYVYVGGRRVAMVKSHAQPACSGATFVVDDVLLYFSDKMDLPRALFRTSDGAAVWRADFDAFASLLALDEDPDGDAVVTRQEFRLPGQIALGPTEGGPSLGAGGLHENWNRVYDSATGRYLEVDPLEKFAVLAEASTSRQRLEAYAYAHGSPLLRTDRMGLAPCKSGRCPDCPGGGWVGAAAAVVAAGGIGPVVGGGNFISGALVCTSRPSVGMFVSALCVGGVPLIKIPGIPAEEALGAGAGVMVCRGFQCVEDMDGAFLGAIGIAGPVMGFTFYNGKGGGCVGVAPLIGGGGAAAFGGCAVVANE